MGIPLHSQIRRKLRTALNFTLSKLSYKQNSQPINPTKIKKILLIRINYRIGNIIFMTPLIRALEKKLPHAKVDMMVGAPFTAPIVQEMPNIDNVYPMPRELTKNPIKLFQEMKKINQNDYDLVINPVSGSVSTNIATFLTKAKLKLGFYNPNTWIPVNRSLPQPRDISHEALKPLALMDIFEGEKLTYNQFLDIVITDKERAHGRELLQKAIPNINNKKVIAIFRDARNEKKIADSWWRDFVQELQKKEQQILCIDILAPNEKSPLLKDMPSIAASNLRELAHIFAACESFICADTGPMHLASASLTPTIAFFNATDPSNYGPLGEKDIAIDIKDKEINEIVEKSYDHLSKVLH